MAETRRRRRQAGAVVTHLPVCSTINDVVSKQPRSTDDGGSAVLVPAGRRGCGAPARSLVPDDAGNIRAEATVGRRGGTVGGSRSSAS